MSSEIDEIKKRLRVDEVLSEYIKLSPAGSSYKAVCPFHNEKSPSFYVSPDRGIYKCFGCGQSGDIFSFVQEFEGLEFYDTLKKLADKAGVKLEERKKSPERSAQKKKEERLLRLLEDSCAFYHLNLLKSKTAKDYLKKRGVDGETARAFRIGFGIDAWNDVQNHLKSRGYSDAEMEEVGLIKKGNKGGFYDRFRNRVLFPIFDELGRCVAFSGRDLSGGENVAKYLNSPETLFFDKSNVMFGYNFAKTEARKRDYFIIVEGQMDLVMSHKVGFVNTVATSGTSLTDRHLKNLERFSKNIIFAFDSDNAGIEAAYKGFRKALAMDFDVKILDIPKGSDPADIILEDGNKWLEIVANSKNIIDFYISKILTKDLDLKKKVAEMEERILPFVAEITSPIEKGKYISSIAKGFDIEESYVLESVENAKKKNESENIDEKVHLKVEDKFDFLSKNNIIEKTKKEVLKQIAAIYFWQNNSSNSKKWVEPKEILNKLGEYVSSNSLEKIKKMEGGRVASDLIFKVESLYEEKEEKSLAFDLESFFKRLSDISKKEKITFLEHELLVSNGKTKMEILQQINNLNKK